MDCNGLGSGGWGWRGEGWAVDEFLCYCCVDIKADYFNIV